MSRTHFNRIFIAMFALLISISTTTICKADTTATYEKNGSIHLGTMTLVMAKSGNIIITNPQGDRYNIYLSLTSQKNKKWMTGAHLKDKKIQVDIDTQKTIFTANLPKEQSDALCKIEYTLGINDQKKVEISLRFVSEVPIEKILSLKNLLMQASRPQMAGSQIQIDKKTFQLDTRELPKSNGINMLYHGPVKRIGCFANQPTRALILRPMRVGGFAFIDANVIAPNRPYVEWRFLPLDNEVVFEVDVPHEAAKVQAAAPPKKTSLSSDNQTYEGVDFRKENHYRVPQYNLTRNLIPNGGFEQGLKYWQFGGRAIKVTQAPPEGGYYYTDTKNVYQGKRSLKILIRKGQMPSRPATFAMPVKTNETYTLSFYAKTDVPNSQLRIASMTAVFGVSHFIYWGMPALTTKWKHYTFTQKANNGAIHIGFLPFYPKADGHIWLDAVQLEKGDVATKYIQPKFLATLVTSKKDHFFEPTDKIKAHIRINGSASQSVNLSMKLSNFSGKVLENWKKQITLNKSGEAIVLVEKAQSLATGFYRIETILRGDDGVAIRDYDRLTVMPFIKKESKHKQLFAVGATGDRRGNWKQRLERWRNMGVGAAIYNTFFAQNLDYLKMHKQYGIFAFGSIFNYGHKAGELDLRASENNILNDKQLKEVEEDAYQKAKAYPWQNTWKLANEPNASKENMKAFVKIMAFAKRGVLRANPKARIVSPDPSNMYRSAGIEWIKDFIEAGGLEVCDIIAIHPYRPIPESPSLDRDISSMLKMLDENNYHGEVWFTEGIYHQNRMLPSYGLNVYKGCSSDHWRVGAFSYDLGLGEKMCFAYTMRSYLAALKHGDRIKMFVDWGLNQNTYMDLDMTPTASSFAPNTLTRLLGNADYAKTILLGMDLHCEVFQDNQQRPVAVLWSSMRDVDRFRAHGPMIDLSNLPTGTQIYNSMGRKLAKMPTTMELSPFPFFLRSKPGNLDKLVTSLTTANLKGKLLQSLIASFRMKDTKQASIVLKNIRSKPFKGQAVIKDLTQDESQPITQSLSLGVQGNWEQKVALTWPKEGLLPINYAVKVVSDQGISLLQRHIKMEVIRVSKLKTKLQIDGDLSDWPTNTKMSFPNRFINFKDRSPKRRAMIPRKGDADLSATLFSGWHPSGLYLAIKVRDNDHTPVANIAQRWNFDSIQLYFDGWFDGRDHPNAGFDHNDQTLAIMPMPNGSAQVYRGVAPEQQLGFLKIGLNTKVKAAFKRTKDGYSIYEIFIPVEQLVAERLKSGESFGFALLINDNDHDYRKRGLTLTSNGTQPYMHPELYPMMILE